MIAAVVFISCLVSKYVRLCPPIILQVLYGMAIAKYKNFMKKKPLISEGRTSMAKVFEVDYLWKGKKYIMIVPRNSRKRETWTSVKATFSNDVVKDVTEEVLQKAGPYKDFFGCELKARQIIRKSVLLKFKKKSKVIKTITN